MNAMRPIHPGEVLKEELSEISMTDRQCLCPGTSGQVTQTCPPLED